jgi:hypothetical protein
MSFVLLIFLDAAMCAHIQTRLTKGNYVIEFISQHTCVPWTVVLLQVWRGLQAGVDAAATKCLPTRRLQVRAVPQHGQHRQQGSKSLACVLCLEAAACNAAPTDAHMHCEAAPYTASMMPLCRTEVTSAAQHLASDADHMSLLLCFVLAALSHAPGEQ